MVHPVCIAKLPCMTLHGSCMACNTLAAHLSSKHAIDAFTDDSVCSTSSLNSLTMLQISKLSVTCFSIHSLSLHGNSTFALSALLDNSLLRYTNNSHGL